MLLQCYQSDKPTSRTADASVIITVLDINDNLPIFNPVSYNVSLIENAYGYVSKVTAMDQDQVCKTANICNYFVAEFDHMLSPTAPYDVTMIWQTYVLV